MFERSGNKSSKKSTYLLFQIFCLMQSLRLVPNGIPAAWSGRGELEVQGMAGNSGNWSAGTGTGSEDFEDVGVGVLIDDSACAGGA